MVVGNGIVYIQFQCHLFFNTITHFIHAHITCNYSLLTCMYNSFVTLLNHSFLCRRDIRYKSKKG